MKLNVITRLREGPVLPATTDAITPWARDLGIVRRHSDGRIVEVYSVVWDNLRANHGVEEAGMFLAELAFGPTAQPMAPQNHRTAYLCRLAGAYSRFRGRWTCPERQARMEVARQEWRKLATLTEQRNRVDRGILGWARRLCDDGYRDQAEELLMIALHRRDVVVMNLEYSVNYDTGAKVLALYKKCRESVRCSA